MPRYLMVPIRLDALYVQDDEMSVVSQNANFSLLPFLDRIAKEEFNSNIANISEAIVSQPFQNKNLRLGHGIHLHWALPDALTRGDSGLNFPSVPNRWLVTRRIKNGEEWPVSKQWIVESDYLYPPGINKRGVSVSIPYFSINWEKKGEGKYEYNPSGFQYDKSQLSETLQKNTDLLNNFFGNSQAPLLPLNIKDPKNPYQGVTILPDEKQQFEQFLRHPLNRSDQPFRFMGRKMPVSAWQENFDKTEYYPNLPAVGYGEPTFAAFYPNCFSVFGLHDDLKDLDNPTLSNLQYEIVGWYSDESKDLISEFVKNNEPPDLSFILTEESLNLLKLKYEDIKDPDFTKLLINLKKLENCRYAMEGEFIDALKKMIEPGEIDKYQSVILKYARQDTNNAILEKFNWEVDSSDIPNRMLCYAGLSFEATNAVEHINKTNKNVTVTVANTPTEALSACLANKFAQNDTKQKKNIEDQLEAMQLSFRLDQKKLDVVSRFNQMRHENGFMPIDSGQLWVIRKETTPSNPQGQGLRAAGLSPLRAPDTVEENTLAELPDSVAVCLSEVNRLQRAYDNACHEIEAMRRQLFADWYKYMICVYPPESVAHDYPDPDLVKYFIETRILAPLGEKIRATGELNLPDIDKHGNIVSISASSDSDASSLADQLTEKAGELIKKIKDAEKEINEENKKQALRFSLTEISFNNLKNKIPDELLEKFKPIKDQKLKEKDFSDSILSYIAQEQFDKYYQDILISAEKTESAYTVVNFHPERIPAPRFWQPANPVVLIEGDVVTPTQRHGQDGQLTCAIFDSGETPLSDPDESKRPTFNAITEKVNELKNDPIYKNDRKYAFGFNKFNYQPWNPFLLEWQVNLFPMADSGNLDENSGAYRQKFITDNYITQPPDPDLILKPGKGKITDAGRIYTGESIITPQAGMLLKQAIETELIERQKIFEKPDDISSSKYKEDFNNPVYSMIRAYEELKNLNSLSQSLNGFNKALLMSKQTMELAVEDPLGFETYRHFTDQEVREAIGKSLRVAPSPLNSFNPIRSGCLKLLRLRLVDTFGQTRDLSVDQINTTYLMTTPANPYLVQMPPRLAQPAQLNFRWLDGDDGSRETNSHAATTPICGWLLTNRLDKSLMFYDASGKSLGYFQAAKWWEAIDSDQAVEIKDIGNPHLRKVAEYVRDSINKNKEFLGHFLGTINDALEKIHPEKDTGFQSPALLMGRPVAVVRAALNLELCGPPAINQDWNVFRRDFAKTTRTDDRFPQVKFPVRLGEYKQLNDGLVGYWLENKAGSIKAIRLTAKTLDWLERKFPKKNTDDKLKASVNEKVWDELGRKKNQIYTNPSDFLNDLKKNIIKHQLEELKAEFSKPKIMGPLKDYGLESEHIDSIKQVTDTSIYEYLRNVIIDSEGGDFRLFERELRSVSNYVNSLTDSLKASSSATRISEVLDPVEEVKKQLQAIMNTFNDPLEQNNMADIPTTTIYYAPQNQYLESKMKKKEQLYEHFHDEYFNFSQSVADPPQVVTMLMDVEGSIRATVGIVPCKEITIPPEQYVSALKNIEITFLHAPLLTRQTKLDLTLRPVHQYAWSWVERQKDHSWKELFPENRIEQGVFVEQWNKVSETVPGDKVWEYLLRDDVKWLTPEDDSQSGTSEPDRPKPVKAIVVNKQDRKAVRFEPFAINSIVYDIQGMEEQVEAILDIYSVGIVPAVTDAVFTGQQEIREGWLKLRKVEK